MAVSYTHLDVYKRQVEEAAKKLVKVTGTEEPDPELVQKYEERYQEFKKLYPALKGIYQGKQA